MAKRVVIVGSGIIGAATAYRLGRAGADVVIVDGGAPGATAASFGWLNASFHHGEDHYRLRVEGLAAYDRLLAELEVPVRMTGCLSTEFEGERMRAEAASLRALGYAVEEVDRVTFGKLEPAVAAPDAALRFPDEGVAEPAPLNRALLNAAALYGARIVSGVRVDGLIEVAGRIIGVETGVGTIAADEVLVCAGTGTEALIATAGHRVPMVPRPAYVIETRPVAPVLSHVLATPDGELRQRPDGVLVMPASVSHQGDKAESLGLSPEEAAEATIARIRALLPGVTLDWASVRLAYRPMPADGLPAVGRLSEGLSVAVMHSGMTLAAVIGECLAREVIDGPSNMTEQLLAAFRPQRFV